MSCPLPCCTQPTCKNICCTNTLIQHHSGIREGNIYNSANPCSPTCTCCAHPSQPCCTNTNHLGVDREDLRYQQAVAREELSALPPHLHPYYLSNKSDTKVTCHPYWGGHPTTAPLPLSAQGLRIRRDWLRRSISPEQPQNPHYHNLAFNSDGSQSPPDRYGSPTNFLGRPPDDLISQDTITSIQPNFDTAPPRVIDIEDNSELWDEILSHPDFDSFQEVNKFLVPTEVPDNYWKNRCERIHHAYRKIKASYLNQLYRTHQRNQDTTSKIVKYEGSLRRHNILNRQLVKDCICNSNKRTYHTRRARKFKVKCQELEAQLKTLQPPELPPQLPLLPPPLTPSRNTRSRSQGLPPTLN